MPDRHRIRREALVLSLRAGGVDGFLVSSRANVGYLTGFSGSDANLLVTPDRAVLLTDGRYTAQAESECPGLEAHIRGLTHAMTDAVATVAGRLGLTRVAFEAPILTVAEREDLQAKAPAITWAGARGWVEALRAVKDEDEVAAIRQAIGFAEDAFREVTGSLDLSSDEKALADALEAAMKRRGAKGSSFPPIVAVGENAALPHYQPRDTVGLGDGDFVLIDWGATGRPYKSDLTRVVVTGKVTDKFREVYRIVLSAQERALGAIRPGVRATEVDAAARSVIEAAGYGRHFEHGLGHGIGREIHEDPRVREGSATVLQAGMVLTVEPGIYLPGWGGVRIEDDVLVTPDGCEILTSLPKALDA